MSVHKGTLSFSHLKLKMLMGAFFSVCCLLLTQASDVQVNSAWKWVSPGIEYQDLKNDLAPWSHVHVFRIHLSQNQLAIVSAKDLGLQQAFVSELANQKGVKLAINGGFFDARFRPLGLRIDQAQKNNPLKRISWWGVFYIANGKASIQRSAEFVARSKVSFAIQSGPRLLVSGHIPLLKPGRDERTALGITQTGAVLIVVTENAPMSTTELAKMMRSPPIFAQDALNLDGGSSTQLFTQMSGLHLDIHGFSMVADAVVVKGKA